MRRLVLTIACFAAAVMPGSALADSAASSPRTNPSPPSPPTITVSPNSGHPASTVSVNGSGFAPSQSAILYLDTPDQGLGYVAIGSDGRIGQGVFIPLVDIGQHSMCVKADVTVCVPFTVTDFQPTIRVSPSSGSPGTEITIEGSGFPPNEIVALYQDGSEQMLSTPGPQADYLGAFSTRAIVRSTDGGQHQVCGDTGGPAGSQRYTVKVCAQFTVIGLPPPPSPSPETASSPSPTAVATRRAAQVVSGPPMLPIAGGVALAIALGAGAFFGFRRRRAARP